MIARSSNRLVIHQAVLDKASAPDVDDLPPPSSYTRGGGDRDRIGGGDFSSTTSSSSSSTSSLLTTRRITDRILDGTGERSERIGLGGGEVTGLTPSNSQSPTYATTDNRVGGGGTTIGVRMQSTSRSPSHTAHAPPPAPSSRDHPAGSGTRAVAQVEFDHPSMVPSDDQSNGRGRSDQRNHTSGGSQTHSRNRDSDGGGSRDSRGDHSDRQRGRYRRGLPILQRPEYYTDPPMVTLEEMDENALSRVEVSSHQCVPRQI